MRRIDRIAGRIAADAGGAGEYDFTYSASHRGYDIVIDCTVAVNPVAMSCSAYYTASVEADGREVYPDDGTPRAARKARTLFRDELVDGGPEACVEYARRRCAEAARTYERMIDSGEITAVPDGLAAARELGIDKFRCVQFTEDSYGDQETVPESDVVLGQSTEALGSLERFLAENGYTGPDSVKLTVKNGTTEYADHVMQDGRKVGYFGDTADVELNGMHWTWGCEA